MRRALQFLPSCDEVSLSDRHQWRLLYSTIHAVTPHLSALVKLKYTSVVCYILRIYKMFSCGFQKLSVGAARIVFVFFLWLNAVQTMSEILHSFHL